MTRYFGKIGYGRSVESPENSGVWVDQILLSEYYGDVIRNTRKLVNGEGLNNDISVGNSISIVADQYAFEHFFNIKFIEWAGVNWVVDNVDVQPPRLILSLGGVYNGPTS